MGHYVFIIGPFVLLLVIFLDVQLLRWLAFVVPAFRKKTDPAKIAAARERGDWAYKRAADPKPKLWVAIVVSVLFIGTTFLMPIGFFLPTGLVQKIFRRIGYCKIVIDIYLLLAFALFRIIALLFRICGALKRNELERGAFYRIGLGICIIAALGMVVYGEINARIIRVNHYAFTVEKDGGNIPADADGTKKLRIALIGDLHLGYNAGLSMMQDMVEKINKEDVDLIFVAGDVFDNAYEAIEKTEEIEKVLAGMKARYGKYVVFGNHDVEDNLIFGFNFTTEDQPYDPRYYDFLTKSDLTVLEDSIVGLFDGSLVLVGRRDAEETGLKASEGEKRATPAELTADLDKSKILVDLEHEPKEVKEVADAGFDMQLCGHTHNGQFFPLNLGIDKVYFNAFGYKLYENRMHTVTTSGVGSYGPFNRACTDSEIAIVDVTFK